MSVPASPVVSVIVVTWNSRATIGLCLDSVSAQRQENIDLELIVVDNASTDGTSEEVRRCREVRLLVQEKNLGFCGGNNAGIRAAEGRFILLLNPDAIITRGFLKEALAVMEADDTIALLTGKVLRMRPDGQPVEREGRAVIDTVGIAIQRNRQAIELGSGERDQGQYEVGREVFGISGAVCLCRATALAQLQVDGQVFDESFFAYKEDVDLSWRARLLGWKCSYTPRVVAYHARNWGPGRRARHTIPRRTRHHSFKNRRLMIFKNEMIPLLFRDAGPLLWFELRALVYVICREPFLLMAYWDLLKLLPRAWRWRRTIQARRQVSWRGMQGVFQSF